MGRIRVHLLTAGLLAAGLALYGGLVHRLPTTTVPLRLPWPLVAAGFAATTVFAVHLEFRRHAHSFLLSELPLVLGLYLLSPPELVLARLAGSAAVLVLHRRQAATKLAFNLALFLFQTCLAASVFALLRGDQPLGPRGWAAALLATLTVDLAGALVVVTAVSLYERAWQWRIWPEVAGAGALAAVANTSLALVAVLTLAADPRAGALLRAETAELLLHEQGRGPARLVRLAGDGGVVDLGPPGPPGPLFEVPGGATAIHPRPIADRRVRAEAERRGLRDAVVAALPGADRPLGALLVGNRLGDVSTFDEEDAKLLEALANQASVALPG